MAEMKQQTLTKSYTFEGIGLHTGKYAHMTILPAPCDTGIVFVRSDMGGVAIRAVAENVTNTARSTTLSNSHGVSVVTVEHILSALTGMGVDNAVVEIDNVEIPILDGSARLYVEAIAKDGLAQQENDRKYIDIQQGIEIKYENTGSYVKIIPADEPSFELTVDFDSKVLGVQTVTWSLKDDYATEVAPCRTFVFFHELEFLASQGLSKGGDMDNAIVVVERPTTPEQIAHISKLFRAPKLTVSEGYLTNLSLHFPDECGRHKLLDLIGDMRLCGGYLNAKIIAYKPGHGINTATAKAVRMAVHKNKLITK